MLGNSEHHGTRCAGEIAGARDNGVCGVGVAYDSKVAAATDSMRELVDAQEPSDNIDLFYQSCRKYYIVLIKQFHDRFKLEDETYEICLCGSRKYTEQDYSTKAYGGFVSYEYMEDNERNEVEELNYKMGTDFPECNRIRMLDQPYMTDLIEANSMGHEPNLIDIYSASWGPTDDGKTVDGPRNATMRAIVRGVNEGRNGLGNIYVWASGDGGADDDCNCDGYAASMWTISINSAINDGQNAHYDESCSSTLASTFSNGAKDPNTGVATTDLYGKCTKTHSGTSAAAPEAAGVFALALEANKHMLNDDEMKASINSSAASAPSKVERYAGSITFNDSRSAAVKSPFPLLTWRDVQHLTVLTSKRNSLFDAKNRFHWTMNGVGLEFNHLFGFGVLDAGAMVALAKHQIPSNGSLILRLDTSSCQGQDTEVDYLEHVQAVITVESSRRGDLEMHLTSPMKTR
nr:EOG090X02T5 [Artemia franciscana]